MADSKFSSIRSSYSSYIDDLEIHLQLAELDSLLDDYDLLPSPRQTYSDKSYTELGKFSKSEQAVNNLVDNESQIQSGPSQLNKKISSSELNLSNNVNDKKARLPPVAPKRSKLPRLQRKSDTKDSGSLSSSVTKKMPNDSIRIKKKTRDPVWGKTLPKSELTMTNLGKFSQSQLILTDIDIGEGTNLMEKSSSDISLNNRKTYDSEYSASNIKNTISRKNYGTEQTAKVSESKSGEDVPAVTTSQLMKMTCFGKVGSRTATSMVLPASIPPQNLARQTKAMNEKRARDKKSVEVQMNDAKRTTNNVIQDTKIQETAKIIDNHSTEKADKVVDIKNIHLDEQENQLIESDNHQEELTAEENELKIQQEKQKLISMEEQIQKLGKMLGQFDKIITAKELAYEQGVKTLKRHTSELVREIYDKEDKMLKDLDKTHKEDIEKVNSVANELSSKLDSLKNELAAANTGLILNSDAFNNQRDSGYIETDSISGNENDNVNEQVHVTAKEVSNALQVMITEVPNVIWGHRTVVRFVHEERPPNIGTFQECYMNEDFNKVTRCRDFCNDAHLAKPRPKSYYDDSEIQPVRSSLTRRRAQSMMIIRNDQHEQPTPSVAPVTRLFSEPRLQYRLMQKGTHKGGIHNPIDACFLPNGNVLIAEFDNQRLQEFDMAGESVQLFNSVPMKPWGVTLTKEGYIAMTCKNDKNIKVFTRGGDLLCKFGTGYFKDPSAISVTQKDLYIINENAGPWQQFMYQYNPMTGNRKKIGNNDNGTYVINNPEYSSVNKENGNILITDSGLHCVWVFSKDLELLFKFGKLGNDIGDLNHPKGICIDTEGNILVSDCANHRIVKFSAKGVFIETVLSAEHGLNYPQIIHANNAGKLVVVQNSEVLLFQL